MRDDSQLTPRWNPMIVYYPTVILSSRHLGKGLKHLKAPPPDWFSDDPQTTLSTNFHWHNSLDTTTAVYWSLPQTITTKIFLTPNPSHLTVEDFLLNWLINTKNLHLISFSECAVTITQPSGVITSPGFPQPYRNGIDCTWNIQLQIGQLINISFLHFELYSW